jgi:rhamnose utilization protein RhaD (predicted bifunctional aldolase and dehydrogenase)
MPQFASPSKIRADLIALSHDLGIEARHLAILGEGNTSARLSDDTFLVKASGCSLGTLGANDLTEVRFEPLLRLIDASESAEVPDEIVDRVLSEARVDSTGKKPSTEAFFHAYLLTLPGIAFVGHTHPVSVNGVLCSPRAEAFATGRQFPDEIVCCGPRSVFVPYVDPGIALARAIRQHMQAMMSAGQRKPKVILLRNHGLIAIGATPAAVKATTLMADKSARIFTAAAANGGPVFLSNADIARIDSRLDEAYRQRVLQL